jgi:isoleucyl-tRNA synthetase
VKFEKNSRRRALEYEKDLVQYWKSNKTFEKSIEQRPKGNSYIFYDGPPFITGVPHQGTLLTSIIKDAIPRYWTMKGRRVERVWGWDCHGLPAEVFTEKKLGIRDKRDIGTKVSLEDYINTCRDNMVQTGNAWEDTIDRIGRWVDFAGAYKTMDKDYMESVWWAFKQLYEAGKLYEGERVLLYCVRDATPISKSEVAMDNSYQDVTEPSVYVKLPLVDSDTALLAWTTTPWTLPANTAAAVNKHATYAEVQLADGQKLIIAQELLGKALQNDQHVVAEHTILRTFKGVELVGKSYKPLFQDRGKNAHKIWHADYVDTNEGTGIVHLAPAYGEEDYVLAKQKDFPFVINIDDNGFFNEGEWQGQYVWDANKPIAKELHERGIVWRIAYFTHSYPHCHRCGTKLMYRAHPSWFMNIDGQRELMLEQNGSVNWFPEYIKDGRSAKTIEGAPDWNLSRDRFWATAMPVWKGIDEQGKEHIKVIGSYNELQELSGVALDDYHRPWIDEVTFTVNNIEFKRIDKVLDCWFESGSMPFAQFHYPFENVDKFEQNFPGDFIVEYVGQVRAWFYHLNAVNVGLFGKVPFRTALVHGTIAGNDGRKMSKNYGNYTDPNELMDKFSADSLRFLLLSSPLLNGEDFSLQDKDVGDVARKLTMIWNMYDFFSLYADTDNWDSGLRVGELPADPILAFAEGQINLLDEWIVSRLHQLIGDVEAATDRYDLQNALRPILPFIDDASNWYVRRSRKRFWKSEDDNDKQMAYRTLHYVLVQLSLVLAPFTPFLAEELYRKLTGGESVHLLDWPKAGHINQLSLDRMAFARSVINDGLSLRAAAGIKVRQPLSKVIIHDVPGQLGEYAEELCTVVLEELNVKSWENDAQATTLVRLDTEITAELRREGLMREIVRNVQQSRKQAGLEVNDRINLGFKTDDEELTTVLRDKHLTDLICHETLAISLTLDVVDNSDNSFVSTVKVEGATLEFSITRA